MQINRVNITDKEFFDACLSKDAKQALFIKHQLIERTVHQIVKVEHGVGKDSSRKETIMNSSVRDRKDITERQFWCHFSDKCRFCDGQLTSDTIAKVTSYWYQVMFACHKECKVKGMAEEAYACQMIDADCNYCKWFIRGKGGMNDGMGHGYCGNLKQLSEADSSEVICQSNTFAGKYCFEHRKPPLKD